MTTPTALLRWIIVILSALVVQFAVVSQIRIFGVVPNILVVLALCAGLTGGPQRGAVVGWWCGFLFELPRFAHPVGLESLAYCLVAFAAAAAQQVVLQSGRLMTVAVVSVGSLLGLLLYAVEGELFGQHTLTNPSLWRILGVGALVGAATARIGIRVAGWADGAESRSVAE